MSREQQLQEDIDFKVEGNAIIGLTPSVNECIETLIASATYPFTAYLSAYTPESTLGRRVVDFAPYPLLLDQAKAVLSNCANK